MQRYKIEDMSCDHCVRTVEKAIRSVDPQATVTIDLATKEVSVATAAGPAPIAEALKNAGYECQPI
ncbi:heavy-metal-associated domain-containing protein [Rhizobiaceae bacterium n13]|uniref:Heavy-metal-associated domain-containing protein n=1 Tax=Ferirhizobium litorale TaxID=2927786 RepID=A0AAE3QEQ5_9HYPH|nr:heavy-metal-associated domain-containing protein [Fererhizobium litorale]MDI7861692.1 heavy-metal-associated domain-containing protein [Fererhizobium litorale]MDI7921966.1 heavy-metal-associated domain-containing protein [Fererhizobium litorale]